jgi:hypothetical protein
LITLYRIFSFNLAQFQGLRPIKLWGIFSYLSY